MSIHVETVAARITVCQKAEQVAVHDRTHGERMFSFFTGQRTAYESVYGEMHDWRFPEEWTLAETVAEGMDAYRPEYRASMLESALNACQARDYLQVDHETGTLIAKEIG